MLNQKRCFMWLFLIFVSFQALTPCKKEPLVIIDENGQFKPIYPGWIDSANKILYLDCDALPCICWNHYLYWYRNFIPRPKYFPNDNIVFHYREAPNTRKWADKCRDYFKSKNTVSCFYYSGNCDEVPYASTIENQVDADSDGLIVQTSCIPASENIAHGNCLKNALFAFNKKDKMQYIVKFMFATNEVQLDQIQNILKQNKKCGADQTMQPTGWMIMRRSCQFFSDAFVWGNYQSRASYILMFAGLAGASYVGYRFRFGAPKAQAGNPADREQGLKIE